MINTRKALVDYLTTYETTYTEEQHFSERFLNLLLEPRCYFRDYLPGHITGSAWIVDETKHYVLLTHHAKLHKWLQPGGHADGDENIGNVALREAEEETGLKDFSILQNTIFDIDIHIIPEGKDFPEHLHFDVRFLLQASRDHHLVISKESHDLAWIKIEDIATASHQNHSMIRMAEKTGLLRANE